MENGTPDQVKIKEKPEPTWIIARDGGLWLVGAVDEKGNTGRLSPVFELHVQVQPAPGGGAVVNYGVQPLMLIASLDTWDLSAEHQSWPVRGSSVARQIMGGIAQAEKMVESMRAAAMGITLSHEMPNGRAPSKLGRVPR